MQQILVVDDHELIRVGIKAALSSFRPDWQICEATDGIGAVNKTSELRPNLVVLDISLPGMNGFEAAWRIRRIAPEIKIVFFTMHDLPTEAKAVGADALVSKEAPTRELVHAIDMVLTGLGECNGV